MYGVALVVLAVLVWTVLYEGRQNLRASFGKIFRFTEHTGFFCFFAVVGVVVLWIVSCIVGQYQPDRYEKAWDHTLVKVSTGEKASWLEPSTVNGNVDANGLVKFKAETGKGVVDFSEYPGNISLIVDKNAAPQLTRTDVYGMSHPNPWLMDFRDNTKYTLRVPDTTGIPDELLRKIRVER